MPLKTSPREPLPTKGIAAVPHNTSNQQVFSVPRLTSVRKEQTPTHTKLQTVYVNTLLHYKKTTLNSNLKAVVSRYYARKAD